MSLMTSQVAGAVTDNAPARKAMWERAAAVLRHNDAGGWTKAAPDLYPHQWSWDSAFIAIGWAQVDVRRAMTEQDRLFAAQWSTGKIPHIVFDPSASAGSYFPDAGWWGTAGTRDAPAGPPYTSGLCQPPVHAIALARIWRRTVALDDPALRADVVTFLSRMYPKVLAWHRFLATARDPECSGLVTIYHPWEGADNSPRWDGVLAGIEIGNLPPYHRRDTEHVSDAGQRPSDRDYDRYLWLVELLKRREYEEERIYATHPFLVKDVFFSAVLVMANEALLELNEVVGATESDKAEIGDWIDRGRRGLASTWDRDLSLCLDIDVRTGQPIRIRTFAGFAALLAGGAEPGIREAALDRLDSASFLGHPKLRWPLLVSTSPDEPTFSSRNYWRGPTWPVVNWLLWRALRRDGEDVRAQRLREASLAQVDAAGFFEYFDPFSGEALGSDDQAWTAAVVLDWLATEK